MRPGNEFIRRRRGVEIVSKCTSLLSMEIELAWRGALARRERDSSVRSRVRAQFCKWICAIAKLAERSGSSRERKKSSRTVLSLPTNLGDSVGNFFVIELISYPRRDLARFSPIRYRYLLKIVVVENREFVGERRLRAGARILHICIRKKKIYIKYKKEISYPNERY